MRDDSLQLLVANLDYSDYVGRLAIGRIFSGEIAVGEQVGIGKADGSIKKMRVSQLYAFEGLKRESVERARFGDIVALAGVEEIEIGETITTADNSRRISVNGVPTSLDEFRGTPYMQMDLSVSRPFKFGDRWEIRPFAEFFNLFNRNNPGANYVGTVAALPVQPADVASGNATNICLDFPACAQLQPITSLKQLEIPAGGLGDFFGPGTTVGIPFAAQLGVRVTF